MTNQRRRTWMAVFLAIALALGGCGQRGQEKRSAKNDKTPAHKSAEGKTEKTQSAEPEKNRAAVDLRESSAPDKGPGPLVTVWLDARGYSAEEAEHLIAQPLEASLKGLKNLRSLRSLSQEGRAKVWVEFMAGTNAASGAVAVRDALSGTLNKLPEDVDTPIVLREPYQNGFAILTLSASRERSPTEVRTLADDVVRGQLETVPSVGGIAILGGSRVRCWITASLDRLAAQGLTLAELARAVEQANAATLAQADDVGQLVVATHNGQPVRVRDVAKIEMSGREGPGDDPPLKLPADVQGAAVFLAVSRLGDGDNADFRRELDRAITKIGKSLPMGVKLERSVPAALAPVVPQLLERMQEHLPPGLRLQAETSDTWGTMLVPESPAPFVVKVQGTDLEGLHKTAQQLAPDLRKVPGIADVALVSPPMSKQQFNVKVDREKAVTLGVAVADITRTVEVAVSARIVAKLRAAGGRQIDVVLAGEDRRPNELPDLRVPALKGQSVHLADVAKIQAAAPMPAPVYRENMFRTVLVLCRVKNRAATEVAADIRRTIDAADGSPRKLPAGCTIRFEP